MASAEEVSAVDIVRNPIRSETASSPCAASCQIRDWDHWWPRRPARDRFRAPGGSRTFQDADDGTPPPVILHRHRREGSAHPRVGWPCLYERDPGDHRQLPLRPGTAFLLGAVNDLVAAALARLLQIPPGPREESGRGLAVSGEGDHSRAQG